MKPEGLYLLSNFVSDEEESELSDYIDQSPWQTDMKRRVQHYGWRYDYRARRVNPDDYIGPLPTWMNKITERVSGLAQFSGSPSQAIINEYLPGQGIAPHIDCMPCFGPVIASLSLNGACEMRFKRAAADLNATLHLPRKSLLILSGPARYDWQHGIAGRKSDPKPSPGKNGRVRRTRRVSITFRTVI